MNPKIMPRVLFILLLLGFCSCQIQDKTNRYQLNLISSYRYHEAALHYRLCDLRGDGSELLITTHEQGSGSYILIQNLQGKAISQINVPEGKIQNTVTLADPKDNSQWLFFTYNDGSKAFLNAARYTWQVPLKREMKSFEPYPRDDDLMQIPAYQWGAMIVPQLLEDIDNDGSLELVCLAIDSFSANPRGLMVFDFETGMRKWFFRTPCNLVSLHFEDLDGDSEREFLLSNTAFNNTTESLNSLDDHSGCIAVLNRFGKMIHQHNLFDGIGKSKVLVKDVDQDGIMDIYALAMTGGVSDHDMILRLRFDGTRLLRIKDLKVPKTLGHNSGNEFLHRLDNSTRYSLIVNDSQNGLRLYDHLLNDVSTRKVKHINRILKIANIGRDTKKEIIAQSNDGDILVLDHRLRELARLSNPIADHQALRIQLISDHAGNNPTIAILSKDAMLRYSLHPIPPSHLIYNTIQAYSLLLIAILMLAILQVLLFSKRQRMGLISLINQLDEGLIVVTGKDKIVYANKAALNIVLEHCPKSSVSSLKESLPNVALALDNLRRSMIDHEDSQILIASQLIRLHIEKLKGFKTRYLICLFKIIPDKCVQNLEWADTARRLSHHVRRHITNIVLALDAAASPQAKTNKEYLDIIGSEIEKIRIFTHAFQRFTEMQDYELRVHNLIPSLEHAIKQAQIPQNLNLIKDYGQRSIHARIEPIRFEEVLINLINNATEAMPDGGTLHLSIKEFPRHHSPKGKLSILIEIEDTGKGIPAKYLEDIWKPFFTTNQSGTGIGLPESKKIIDSMGGIIDIQSEEGLGTTVSLWLKGEHDGSD
jgi:nitrogen-specific signal transduction histidine kinase